MKECRYCGSNCDEQAEVCANCGGSRFLSEEEVYTERRAQGEYKNKRIEYEKKRKRGIIRLTMAVGGIIVAVIVTIAMLSNDGSQKVSTSTGMDKAQLNEAYETAEEYMQQGDYEDAITYFSLIQGYKDSDQQLERAQEKYREKIKPEILDTAQTYIKNNEYDNAVATLEAAEDILPNDLDITALLRNAQIGRIKYLVTTFDADATRHTTDGYAEMIQSLNEENSVISGDVELAAKKNEYINVYRSIILDQAETALWIGYTKLYRKDKVVVFS